MSRYTPYKREVLEATRTLAQQGYFGAQSGTGGNVSVLIEGEQRIVITPSGMPYGNLSEDDLCVVDMEQRRIEGPHEPSVEMPMHLAVYRHRRDVNAVVHTHQPYASVFAVLNEPIPALFDELAVSIVPSAEVIHYALSGSPELLANVVSKLDNRCHCYLMQNHGALNIGSSLKKAVQYAELLEKVAAIYWRALATGRPLTLLPEPIPTALFGLVTGKQDAEIARKDRLEPKR